MKTSTQTAPAAKVNTFSKSELIKAIKFNSPNLDNGSVVVDHKDVTEAELGKLTIKELKAILAKAEKFVANHPLTGKPIKLSKKDVKLQAQARTLLAKHEQPAAPKKSLKAAGAALVQGKKDKAQILTAAKATPAPKKAAAKASKPVVSSTAAKVVITDRRKSAPVFVPEATVQSLKGKAAALKTIAKEASKQIKKTVKDIKVQATAEASKFKVTAKPELVKSVIPTIKSELRAAAYKALAKKGELTVDQVYASINKHCECNRKQVAVALQNLITLNKVARV